MLIAVCSLPTQELANLFGINYFEASAKTGQNIDEIFVAAIRRALASEECDALQWVRRQRQPKISEALANFTSEISGIEQL